MHNCVVANAQAVSKAESQVSEAQQRLMQLEEDKAELDKQLRKTQEAVLAGKQRVEKLREEVQRRTEARTVMLKLQHFASYARLSSCMSHIVLIALGEAGTICTKVLGLDTCSD